MFDRPAPLNRSHKEERMGIADDAKDVLAAAGRKIGRAAEDAKDRVEDKVDEVKAAARVKQAEADRDVTRAKNELKEDLRDDN